MDGQAILTVSGAVVALTQLIKWMGLDDRRAPIAVLGLSALGVVFWGISVGSFARTQAFEYFAGWITVSLAAAGVYGFTRSGPASLTATSAPPAGAGASPTVKMDQVTRVLVLVLLFGAFLALPAPKASTVTITSIHEPDLHGPEVPKDPQCWDCHDKIPVGCQRCHWPWPELEPGRH